MEGLWKYFVLFDVVFSIFLGSCGAWGGGLGLDCITCPVDNGEIVFVALSTIIVAIKDMK